MGKRSDFERIEKDFYRSIDPVIGQKLEFHIEPGAKYYEPCVGSFDLVRNLLYLDCVGHSDITTGLDAFSITKETVVGADYIVTNPPWTRSILHPMINHFRVLAPKGTWLLFDAPWMHTKQARPYLKYCDLIVNVGRVNWIPDTKMKGKDDVCWYHFAPEEVECTEYLND